MEKEKANKRKLDSSSGDDDEEEEEEDMSIGNILQPLELEESESEPEVDCDKWDGDCKVVSVQARKSMTGYHLMPTCSRNPDETPNKKLKFLPEINKHLLDDGFKSAFQDSWSKDKELKNDEIELILSPFKVCVVNNFLDNPAFLQDIRQEFNDVDWNLRSMDLYEFSQSKDLKHLTEHENINLLYKLLQSDVMNWVAEMTGLKLTHMSATCSLYNYTDYLLVHDDQRGDRMVAFILYLSESDGWDEGNGGALELLCKDADGHPADVVRKILPVNNQLVFFPVANDSYHQVSEVTSLIKSRLSINGWFHTDVPPVYTTPKYKPYPGGLFSKKCCRPIDFDSELSSWICESYLECDIIKEVQAYFEEHSEICLKKFLREEPFNELLEILKCDMLDWVKIGPPNRYHYEVLRNNDLPVVLDRFLKLFQSKQMFSLLQRFTGVEFKDKCLVQFELQRWTPGCYSLLGDYDWYDKKQLDLVLYFGCSSTTDAVGARTLYVTTDDEIQDALITLEPEENNLNLIYRDTARFTKYYSKLSKCHCFYTLMCSYTE